MSNINLYKIDSRKKEEFLRNLNEKYDNENNVEVTSKCKYGISVYIDGKDKTKSDPDWLWVLSNPKPFLNQPASLKVVIVIECETKEALYVCTFGMAHFNVDKYCDTEFAFDFARRIKFEQVKTTTLTSPNSKKNKTVNAYLNYSEIAYDSGEAYAKIKAKTLLDFNGEKHEITIEIGHSIKTKLMDDNFEEMIKFIELVEDTMKKPEIQKIPVFAKLKDKDEIKELDQRLLHEISENLDCVNVSELDVVGVTVVFNDNDSEYTLKLHRSEMKVSDLNKESVKKFIVDNNIDVERDFFNIKVIVKKNDHEFTDYMKKLIDYTDDEKYNFHKHQLEDYRKLKMVEERNLDDNKGLTDTEFKNKIYRKYYKERVFNNIMGEQYGFENHDRSSTYLDSGEKIEIMDLYKDKTMFAVKIGSTSSKLNYVVNQSLDSFRLYHIGELKNAPEIDTVAVWLIFDKEASSRIIKEHTDLSELKLLGLKNRLDEWKKEVRLAGKKPVVYVNKWFEN